MTDALRYEWARIITIRSTYWLTGLALAFAMLVSGAASWGFATEADGGGGSQAQLGLDLLGPWLGTQFARGGAPYFVGYLLAMIGILAWGHEYRHGQIRATLTTLSSRTSVWIAKYVVVNAWVAAVVSACYWVAVLVGVVWLRNYPADLVTGETVGGWGRAVLHAGLLCSLAMAFTGIIRNQTAGLVLLFLWPLAIENVITLIFFLVPRLREHEALTRFLPFGAGNRIHSDAFPNLGSTTFGDPLTWVGGLVVFGGLTVVLMAVSVVLFRRRDA